MSPMLGIMASGKSGHIQGSATGGTEVTTGGFKYHTFTASGSLVVSAQIIDVEVLVIAGGGGGGWERGAGAGAGGLQGFTSQTFAAATYTATIGGGGVGATNYNTSMTNGVDSQFGSLTLVKGGGYGGSGSNNGATGNAGGSSGGSGYYSQTSTAALGSQGNAGGASSTSGAAAGGGGGAGAAGSKSVAPAGGAGGVGSSAYTVWGSATSSGELSGGTYYYAGGGAGGCDDTVAVAGGLGGGGGSAKAGATVGTVNTGGGGGGGSFGLGVFNGKLGGSGIIIVRYPV